MERRIRALDRLLHGVKPGADEKRSRMDQDVMRGTTVLCVRRMGEVAMAGDGQVTVGTTIFKQQANKIRRLHGGKVLTGFAGSAADAVALYERLERKIDQYKGNLVRAVVELAKDWRTDRMLRRLEAMLIAADREHSLLVSGSGDVIEPDDGIIAIGSGGPYALAAARALVSNTDLPAAEICKEALRVAASICIYTNENIVIECLEEG